MALTQEEKDQIAAFALEDKAAEEEASDRAERQHLAAQLLRRRIAKEKGQIHGEDFAVLEFDRGNMNVAIRCPTEVEATLLGPDSTPEQAENFVLAIVTHPSANEWLAYKNRFTGAEASVIHHAGELCAGVRKSNAKK